MAIDLTLKSAQITNREALPPVLNSPQNGGLGIMREAAGLLASMPASLSITSIIRMCEVPSNARIRSVKIMSGAQTAGAFDVGIYQTNRNGGAVVDADFFGSGVSLAAAVPITEVLDESGQFAITERFMPLWEALGLTSDPHRMYDVALTCVTTDVTTGLAAVGLFVSYVQ